MASRALLHRPETEHGPPQLITAHSSGPSDSNKFNGHAYETCIYWLLGLHYCPPALPDAFLPLSQRPTPIKKLKYGTPSLA